MAEFQRVVRGPKTPPPGPSDLASFSALQNYEARMMGVRPPEAELRQQWTETPEGQVGERRVFPGNATLTKGAKEFSYVVAPALVIFANPHSLGSWLAANRDPTVQAAIKAYSAAYEAFTDRQIKAVRDGMPHARIVTLPQANNFIFMSNETDVLREMNAFMDGLHYMFSIKS